MGIAVTKKTLKLYADFYSSDIIVASPLGLRMVVGVDGESKRDYDFLTRCGTVVKFSSWQNLELFDIFLSIF